MRISDWSSDVCSSDLSSRISHSPMLIFSLKNTHSHKVMKAGKLAKPNVATATPLIFTARKNVTQCTASIEPAMASRSEEHTYELQSLMRISYDVFCLKKKTQQPKRYTN